MRKELQRIDPLGFSIAREELFIEAYVPFGVDPRCGLSWGLLDGAVDRVVMEVFVDVATVAGDPRIWAPAVNVSTKWVRGGLRRDTWRVERCIPVGSGVGHYMGRCSLLSGQIGD